MKRQQVSNIVCVSVNVKQSRYRPGVVQRVPGSQCSQISCKRHRMVVSLSALRTGRLYHQEIHLVLISVRGWVDPRAMVRPEVCSLSYSIAHKAKLLQHTNQLIPIILEEQGPKRLKRYKPADLTHRLSLQTASHGSRIKWSVFAGTWLLMSGLYRQWWYW